VSVGSQLGCMAAALVLGSDEECRALMRELRASGLDRESLREAVLQTYLFDGYPTALEGLELLEEIWPGDPVPVEVGDFGEWERWRDRGNELYRRIYGDDVAERLQGRARALSPELALWMVVEGYGKVLSRGVLSLAERELINVAVLAVKRRPRQLYSHLRGALRIGVPRERIEDLWNELRHRLSPPGLEEGEAILSGL
jgi:4-carboxymuconolactone decarboxylase